MIIACCILHNICIDNGEDIPPQEFDISYLDALIQNGQINDIHVQNNGNEDRRTVITRNFFS